jgi:hypothetical protein
MSRKDAFKPKALLIAKFIKKGCIFLVVGKKVIPNYTKA